MRVQVSKLDTSGLLLLSAPFSRSVALGSKVREPTNELIYRGATFDRSAVLSCVLVLILEQAQVLAQLDQGEPLVKEFDLKTGFRRS